MSTSGVQCMPPTRNFIVREDVGDNNQIGRERALNVAVVVRRAKGQ